MGRVNRHHHPHPHPHPRHQLSGGVSGAPERPQAEGGEDAAALADDQWRQGGQVVRACRGKKAVSAWRKFGGKMGETHRKPQKTHKNVKNGRKTHRKPIEDSPIEDCHRKPRKTTGDL